MDSDLMIAAKAKIRSECENNKINALAAILESIENTKRDLARLEARLKDVDLMPLEQFNRPF